MSYTVSGAFETFRKNFVDLEPSQVEKARASRDAMLDRINNLNGFLPLYRACHMQFGSFARNTKTRPIDDIDLIVCLSGGDLEICDVKSWADIRLKLKNLQSPLKICCDSTNSSPYTYYSDYYLNSNKVKNKFKSALSALHDCRKAELHSNQEAVTLQFASYSWNFDIVPAFYVGATSHSEEYYLIPNGSGNWKKTNPKKDRDNVSNVNTLTGGEALKLIRLAKYWNKRPTMASMPSYMLEAMVVNFCKSNRLYNNIQTDFRNLLYYIHQNIYNYIDDPKGIQGNINNLTAGQKQSIYNRSYADYMNAVSACNFESQGLQCTAINSWRKVFGNDFPTYG